MQHSEQLVDQYNELKALRWRFQINDVFNHADANEGADLHETATFAHFTASEIGNAINTFTAVIDAIEDGGNFDALLLMKG